MNSILQEDFEYLTRTYDFSELKNKSVFITGATGFIGSQLAKYLDFLNKNFDYGTTISCLIRNKEKAKTVFRNGEDISFIAGDILNLPNISNSFDYIIHGASITSSNDFVTRPVETIDIAVNGTINILKLASQKNIAGMVYISSMEVFGVTDERLFEIKENDYGYIDILNPRSSYSESKRLCECLCSCYANEYSLPVKIARLTQTLGPGIDRNDTRVAAQFARAVIENRDIVLKTEGKTKRPVLYSRDAISAILAVLLKGKKGEAYTAANPATFKTIRETAQIIAEKIAGNRIKVVFDINIPEEYAPNLNLNLNTDKLQKLDWHSSVDLIDAYRRMIAAMKDGEI